MKEHSKWLCNSYWYSKCCHCFTSKIIIYEFLSNEFRASRFCNRIKFLLASVLEELLQFNETYILASQFLKTFHLVSCVSVSCSSNTSLGNLLSLEASPVQISIPNFSVFCNRKPMYFSPHQIHKSASSSSENILFEGKGGEGGGGFVCWANIASFVSRYLIRHLPRCKALEKRAKRRRLFFG